MNDRLEALLIAAREHENNPAQQEAQRRSFAYGNARFSNESITRESIEHAANALAAAENELSAR